MPRHSASKPSREITMPHMGADRSELAQPMHNLNVGVDVLAEIRPARKYAIISPGRERCPPAVVDVYAVGCRWRDLAPVERCVASMMTAHVCA